MLKELFILDNGKPLLHYSPNTDIEGRDEAILASGFFSAISSFLKEARSSQLDNFTSESELFVFKHLHDLELEMVGVFDIDVSNELAQTFIQNLTDELIQTDFMQNRNDDDLNQEKIAFKRKIPEFQAALQASKSHINYLESTISGSSDVMLGVLFDLATKEKKWHYAFPPSLYDKEILSQLNLLDQVTNNLLAKFYDKANYQLITINTQQYGLSVLLNGKMQYMLMGKSSANLKKRLLSMVHLSESAIIAGSGGETMLLSGTKLDKIPQSYPKLTPILLNTLINSITKITSQTMKRNKFDEVEIIFTLDGNKHLIKIANVGEDYQILLPTIV